jgi:hypothetical protein
MRKSFRAGVFALMPPSRILNTFVERTLNLGRLEEWIQLIRACRNGLKELSAQIEPQTPCSNSNSSRTGVPRLNLLESSPASLRRRLVHRLPRGDALPSLGTFGL